MHVHMLPHARIRMFTRVCPCVGMHARGRACYCYRTLARWATHSCSPASSLRQSILLWFHDSPRPPPPISKPPLHHKSNVIALLGLRSQSPYVPTVGQFVSISCNEHQGLHHGPTLTANTPTKTTTASPPSPHRHPPSTQPHLLCVFTPASSSGCSPGDSPQGVHPHPRVWPLRSGTSGCGK